MVNMLSHGLTKVIQFEDLATPEFCSNSVFNHVTKAPDVARSACLSFGSGLRYALHAVMKLSPLFAASQTSRLFRQTT
jgi:hypothetical protein